MQKYRSSGLVAALIAFLVKLQPGTIRCLEGDKASLSPWSERGADRSARPLAEFPAAKSLILALVADVNAFPISIK
jgi:hypothetical protein